MKAHLSLIAALTASLALTSPLPIRVHVIRVPSTQQLNNKPLLPEEEQQQPTRTPSWSTTLPDLEVVGEDDEDAPANRPLSPSRTFPASRVLEVHRPLSTTYLMSLFGDEEEEEEESVQQQQQQQEIGEDVVAAARSWWEGMCLVYRLLAIWLVALLVGLFAMMIQPFTRPSKGPIHLVEKQQLAWTMSYKADEDKA